MLTESLLQALENAKEEKKAVGETEKCVNFADMLNDRAVPFFGINEISVLQVLTDRGSEYCGNREYYEVDGGLQSESSS